MYDFWDDFVTYASSEGASDITAGLADAGSDVNWDEIFAGVSEGASDSFSNMGDGYYDSNSELFANASNAADASQNVDNSMFQGDAYGGSYDKLDQTNSQNILIKDAPGGDKSEPSMFEKASNFIEKNKKLSDMAGGLIGSAYSSREKKKEDAKTYERMLEKRAYDEKIQKEKEDRADARRGGGGGGSSAMEMLAAKDALDQTKNARFSSSITGLRKPDGLINRGKKLTYVGGKPVYTDDGKLAA